MKLKIIHDFDPQNPRTDYDHLGTMYCRHSRYELGDKNANPPEEGDICLSLYLYDHSGITMQASKGSNPFNDQWDSGCVGVIYCSPEKACKEYGVDSLTDEIREKVIKQLQCEVETYAQYLEGDIYGFQLVEEKKCECCGHVEQEVIDSCWGFYGSDPEQNGMREHIPDDVWKQCKVEEPSYA